MYDSKFDLVNTRDKIKTTRDVLTLRCIIRVAEVGVKIFVIPIAWL